MRGMNIQRPIIVTEKQKMYGDMFDSTQGHQHMYECVQPLQGLVTFTEPSDDENYPRNNLSWSTEDRPKHKKLEAKDCVSWDFVIYCMLVVKLAFGGAMLWDIERQTAYNNIYLTNFDPSHDYSTYSVVGAGMTNPLYCLLIALSLVIFSVIIGLTSSKKYILSSWMSMLLFFLLASLQAIAIALHITMLVKEKSLGQVDSLTTTSMIDLHFLTLILSLVGLFKLVMAPQSKQKNNNERKKLVVEQNEEILRDLKISAYLTHEDIYRETTGNFWLCVVEDLNTILCYAFVVLACDAQSSIHDDSTTFFDVLCIVFLGFLQHVANILMIFHAHIEKQTELQLRNMPSKTQIDMDTKKATEVHVQELITFIARTRLLSFFMMGVTVVFFYLRVAPTYEEYPMTIPYEMLRAVALIAMVSLNTFHSLWYEVQNAQNPKKPWDTSPTWKLGALSFIALVFSAMLLYNTTVDKHEDTRYLLHKLTVRTTAAPPGTPSPP